MNYAFTGLIINWSICSVRFDFWSPFFVSTFLRTGLVCSPMQIMYDIYIYLIVIEGLEAAFNFIQILSFCSAVVLTGGKFLTFLLQTIRNYSRKLCYEQIG